MNQLDIDVAKKVMGWTNLRTRRAGEWVGNPPDLEGTYPVSEFSTDHNTAMLVLDKIINLIPGTCTIYLHAVVPGSGDVTQWWAGFDGLWDDETVLGRGSCDSAAGAICHAALDFMAKRPVVA